MAYEFVIGKLPFGNNIEQPGQVFAAVLEAKLEFPKWYKDEGGLELIQGLLTFDQTQRLGTGLRGYEDVRRSGYFITKESDDYEVLFNQIMGREIEAPFVPESEIFASDSELDDSNEGSCVSGGDAATEPLQQAKSQNSSISMCCSCFSFFKAS